MGWANSMPLLQMVYPCRTVYVAIVLHLCVCVWRYFQALWPVIFNSPDSIRFIAKCLIQFQNNLIEIHIQLNRSIDTYIPPSHQQMDTHIHWSWTNSIFVGFSFSLCLSVRPPVHLFMSFCLSCMRLNVLNWFFRKLQMITSIEMKWNEISVLRSSNQLNIDCRRRQKQNYMCNDIDSIIPFFAVYGSFVVLHCIVHLRLVIWNK